jgi:hypothetical protein
VLCSKTISYIFGMHLDVAAESTVIHTMSHSKLPSEHSDLPVGARPATVTALSYFQI